MSTILSAKFSRLGSERTFNFSRIDYISNMLVKIWTDTFIITGEIDTMRDERLTDYVRENKEFIAVTQVNVADREGKDLFRTHFLNVSTSHIEIILPAE